MIIILLEICGRGDLRIFLITNESLKGVRIVVRRSIDRFLSLSISFRSSYPAGVRSRETVKMRLNTVDQIYPRLDNALNVKITSNVVLFRGVLLTV